MERNPRPSSDTTHAGRADFFHQHEQLMRTTFSRDEIEGFYARFDELLVPSLLMPGEGLAGGA